MTDEARIRVLASEVIDRIAAGEVIERPASVVKELVENAFDAAARTVQVDLAGGGLERITVTDDGAGMSERDASVAILRHATSKLASADDLFSIRTLGFRGEALSSIAAVSRLTLTTRRPDAAHGTRVEVVGGEVRSVTAVGAPPGTSIDVRDLFWNTPARRKFMRSPATEQAHAVEAVLRVALGARSGGVVVTAGERRLLDIAEDASPAERARAALGERVEVVYPFDHEVGPVRVSGYLARPELARADAKGVWLLVNGRFVRDRMLQRAVLDGYRTLVERGRYPLLVVFVDLDPAVVDVNVHPQKLEVRFADGAAVFRAVGAALAGTLSHTPWLEASALPAARAVETYLPYAAPRLASVANSGGAYTPHPAPEAKGFFARLRPLGQALGVYLVCEGEDGLVLIDQHAAHERVAFERLRRQAAAHAVVRQPLLLPEVLELDERAQAVVAERAHEVEEYGFEVEAVGPGRFAIRAIPAALSGAEARGLVRDLLDELGALEKGRGATGQDAVAQVLSRCACHAAVRAPDSLGTPEIEALLTELDTVDFDAHCPHGRPVYHVTPRSELARLFHR